jgi:photosystem II stability/assembly factor-like uncharacterized protein
MNQETDGQAATAEKEPGRREADEPERLEVLPFAQRSAAFEWRRRWFELSRSDDRQLLEKSMELAFAHKLELIERAGPGSGEIAGYDPAGAGSPWFSIGPRNVNGRVKALAVHPTQPDTVYAGAASGGVWKSLDGGQTWDPLFDMQESLAIGALGIAASSPKTIYAGTGEWTPHFGPSYPGAGVYVSTDGGATWSLRKGCLSRAIGKLVVDPTNPKRVWICGDAGLERTTDGGLTWTRLHSEEVADIALDPASASTIFIAFTGIGFYKSTDAGASIVLLPGAPTGPGVIFPQLAIGVSGAHGHNFIAIKTGGTVATSIDGGKTFTTVSSGHGGYFGWCDVIACAPDDESILFYGGVALERSTDGGASWSALPVHPDQHAAVFAPSDPSVVYFANDGGVWRSDDKGATVRKVSNGLVITQFYNIGYWQPLSNVVGGGSQDNATQYTTSGLTWQPVWTNDGGWFVIDPTNPRTMYAEGQNGYLAKSTDGGATWVTVTAGITGTTPFEAVLTMDPNNHLRLYYGTDRVLRTLDGCSTPWSAVSQVLSSSVSSIAVAPSDSKRVYAGTIDGHVYRSDDGGDTSPWADKSSGLPSSPVSGIWIAPGDRDRVVLSLGGLLTTGEPGVGDAKSVYLSTNGGNSWTNISGDLPVISANAVVGDPSSATTYYLATDSGVYRTTDGGAKWAPFDNGIPNAPVADLTVDWSRKILYAGTFGRGAYRLDITPGVTKPQVDLYLRDDDLDTGSLIPSPSGLPDPLVPSPATADWWTSPDIKVNHSPFYTPAGTVFDGVDFDISLVHQDPHRTETNRIYLQVHNRGWKPASSVSVRAFVADASAGLPALPNALVPPAFDLTSTSTWTPVGPAQTIPLLQPNRPAIVHWDFTFPASSATHTCCLAVISSADDPFTSKATDIGTLVTGDKHACLKNLHVIDPGPAPAGLTLVGIDFHNPGKTDALADILIRPSLFERGTVALLLPRVELANGEGGLRGGERQPLSSDDPVGEWYLRGKKGSENELGKRWAGLDRSGIWVFNPAQVCSLSGIRMKAGETLRGVLVVSHKRDVPTAVAPRIAVEQWIGGVPVGGSTFQVGYDGESSPAQLNVRRLRIVANRLEWHEAHRHAGETLWARTTLGDDPDRASLRMLGKHAPLHAEDACIFDGYVADGESLTIELFEGKLKGGGNRDGECIFRHRFDGPIVSWLRTYKGAGQKDELRVLFTVTDLTGSQEGAD